MKARLLAVALFAFTLASGAAAGDADAKERDPVVHRVVIRAMEYVPQVVEVRRGDRILWINEDIVPHTVTATDQSPDSGLLQPQQSWTWVADEEGEHAYVCTYHPPMKGTVIVK